MTKTQITGAVMASLVLTLGACASDGIQPSPTADVFGVESGCAPLDAVDNEIVVVPGVLAVNQPGMISDIQFVWGGSHTDNEDVTEWFALSGLRAGDLVSARAEEVRDGEQVVMTPLAELAADSPGEWLIALGIPRSSALEIALSGVEYSLDGERYIIEDQFRFQVPCQD